MLIRADALCNTLVCRDPPDIESGFELALGRAFVAIATVIMGERRCVYALLMIDSFFLARGFYSDFAFFSRGACTRLFSNVDAVLRSLFPLARQAAQISELCLAQQAL